MSRWKLGGAVGLGLIVLVGASLAIGAGRDDNPDSMADDSGSSTTSGDGSSEGDSSPSGVGDCPFDPGEAYVTGPTEGMKPIGEQDGIRVEAAIYPRPDYAGNPWSQWGQGLVLEDGRVLSAIGDHLGVDGNSYIYEYDPETDSLTMIGDVLSYVDHQSGSWGYGKIHGQMVRGSCGEVYLATYWGTSRDLSYDGSYSGDLLLRVDPGTRTIASLGVPVQERGIPSLAGFAEGGLVFGEALDPAAEWDWNAGPFFVYDTASEEVVFEGPDAPHLGYRNILVDAEGRAYYSMGEGELAVYDPDVNDISTHDAELPGEWMRASTAPTSDGRVFGVTDEENALFVLQPSGEIESLGTTPAYTASMAVHPDGDRFFYVPDAHGGAWEWGAPLVSVDAETGEQTTLVELEPMAEEELGLRLGGTYNVTVDPSGEQIYIGMNASPVDDDSGFGEVVFLVVHLS